MFYSLKQALQNYPTPTTIREERTFIPLVLALDAGHVLGFDYQDAYKIDNSADGTDDYRKQHASRSGIYIKIHHPLNSRKCLIFWLAYSTPIKQGFQPKLFII